MHAHILPGIDDGSSSIDMSNKMLDAMKQADVRVVCATSHYYSWQNDIETFLKRRNNAYRQLVNNRGKETLPIILPASETAFFKGISKCERVHDLCIHGTNTLMLEMPFLQWSEQIVEEVEGLVLDRDIRVVLVHPERFCFSKENKKYIERLLKLDIALQVNAGSFIDHKTRKLAFELIQISDHPLLGSDCHNVTTRPFNLMDARSIIEKKLGKGFVEKIEKTCYQYMYDENYGK